MELVAERGLPGRRVEHDFARFQTLVAFGAIAGRGESILTVMANAAGSALFHINHGAFADNGFERENFGMALFAAVRLGMDSVAEGCRCYSFQGKGDFRRFKPLVAAVTVCCNGKCAFAIVAGTAGAPFFHFCHCYRFILAGYDFAVVAPFAGAACFGDMQ